MNCMEFLFCTNLLIVEVQNLNLNNVLNKFMSSQKILVTGGAGYIGSHICKLLAARGDVPTTVDNLSTGHPWAVKWGAGLRKK